MIYKYIDYSNTEASVNYYVFEAEYEGKPVKLAVYPKYITEFNDFRYLPNIANDLEVNG